MTKSQKKRVVKEKIPFMTEEGIEGFATEANFHKWAKGHITYLQELIEKTDKDAKCLITEDCCDNYGYSMNACIVTYRDETDKEYEKRIAKMRKTREKLKKEKEKAKDLKEVRDRRQYERLRKQFGDN